MSQLGLLVTPLLPLLLAALGLWPRCRPLIIQLAPWAALPGLLTALSGATDLQVQLPGVLLGVLWKLDALGRAFLGFTALLWLVCGWYARGQMRNGSAGWRFSLFWLLTLSGNLGLIVALDIASFYTAFALMTFSAYGLIIHKGQEEALRAGRVYLALAVIGEGLILAGLLLAAGQAEKPLLSLLPDAIAVSPARDLTIACLWSGFGIKAGVFLLHVWLPLAHPVAPTPASAVLSGAMIKAGLLGWLRTLPLGVTSLPDWGELIMSFGLLAVFGAALLGVTQRECKAVLAYSSISQMGLITLAVGAGLYQAALWPQIAPAIVFYALHHSLAKGALFLGVGMLTQHSGRAMRSLLWLALALPALSLSGFMTSGATAKLMFEEALTAGQPLLNEWHWLKPALSYAAVATTLLMARYLWLLRQTTQHDRPPTGQWLGWAGSLLASITGLYWLPRLTGAGLPLPDAQEVWHLAWPVLVGILLSIPAVRWLRPLPLPPGDLLIPVLILFEYIRTLYVTVVLKMKHWKSELMQRRSDLSDVPKRWLDHSPACEHSLRRESALVFALLMLLLIQLLL